MAEGFVVPSYETQCLKALGDEYFMLLLQRCFFQDVTRDQFGEISSFKMHDLALDVCGADTKVAKLEDKNFTNRIRHLSFDHQLTNSWETPSCMLMARQLRTFILPQQFRDGSDFNSVVLQQLISSFRCLRVLDLRNLGFRIVPKSIGKLIHLRYLNLSKNPIEMLPNSITKLQNLQTLILKSCYWLGELPIDTRKLTNLRTLDVLGCHKLTDMPPGLGELTSLHKLPYFVVMSNPANAQLRDLKTLNNLSGSLHIQLLEYLESPASEAKEANLIAKHRLTNLLIGMGMSYHDEAILEGLKPHQNLKKLEINWYEGERLPSWAVTDRLLLTLPNLVEVRLYICSKCKEVPCFSQLPFLKYLTLSALPYVEYMEKSPLYELDSPPRPSTRTFFPSLLELDLYRMDKLKGWWEETKVVDCTNEEKILPSLSSLAKLGIERCLNLASFPGSPNIEELKLSEVKKELTVLKKVTSYGRSGDVGSSKLKRLSIDDVQVLISMPIECLGQLTSLEIIRDSELKNTSELEGVFKHLSSLTCLKFSYCHGLTTILVGMEHLVSLETLTLDRSWELDISEKGEKEDGMPWKALKSLRRLTLSDLRKLEHLPNGLQHLTNLRHLRLSNNHNLEEVPEWIGRLSSLDSMQLEWCDKLRCLPVEMRKLISLNQLKIYGCDGLTERCRGPNGVDWPYIRHIPLLSVHGHG